MSNFERLREDMARKVRDPSIVSLKGLAAAFDVNYGTARRWMKQPGFPPPFYAGSRPRWRLDDLVWWALRVEGE